MLQPSPADKILSMESFDLRDYSDSRLTESGELVIPPSFEDPFYVVLGDLAMEHVILEVSRVVEPTSGDRTAIEGLSAYIIRNLSSPEPTASILFGNDLQQVEEPVAGRFQISKGTLLVIGRGKDATPALDLSEVADYRHAELRVGRNQGNLHLLDLDSSTGTIAYLSSRDNEAVKLNPPRRVFVRVDPETALFGLRLVTEVNKSWFRRGTKDRQAE